MGNIIRLHSNHQNTAEWLSMSNGGTSVFISTLVLSGSKIASTDREKELIIWLSEHDQSVIGIGTVGFHISEMPWKKEDFKEAKEFILNVIKGVKAKVGWETLAFQPNEEFLISVMKQFEQLILAFEEKDIDETAYVEWNNDRDDEHFGIPKNFPKCPKHDTYLYWNGCVVCNEF